MGMVKHNLICLLFLFFFLMLWPFSSYTQAASPAEKGEVDLKEWIPSPSADSISLEGNWSFYWNALLTPEQIPNYLEEPAYVKVPSEWSRLSEGTGSYPNEGFATYRLLIHLNEQAIDQPLALQIPTSNSAYKVWVNGQPRAESGIVGTSALSEKPWTMSQMITITPSSATLELVVQVSNFHQRRNGIWDSFVIGHSDVIMKENAQAVTSELIILGSLLIMSTFYFFTYFFRRTDIMAFYFSGMCLMFSIRLAVTDGYILRYFIPDHLFFTVYKLEYLSISICILLLIYYISHIFPNEKQPVMTKVLVYLGMGYSFFLLATPPDIFTYTIYFQFTYVFLAISYHIFYVYPLAIYRKRQWAWANFIGSLIVVLVIMNDWFYYIGGSSATLLYYFGVFLFFLVQIITMANQMADAYKRLEVVSDELIHLNGNLEHIVSERTRALHELNEELAASNQKLKKVEISRRKLLSNISHDLGTPMQTALGFVEMLKNGLIQENKEKYLNLVMNKLLFMKKLTDDLFELAKLEENQITYHFVEENAALYLKSIKQQFIHDFTINNLSFIVDSFPALPASEQAYITIDVFRMNQVIQNLLQNAMKFTPEGGTIQINTKLQRNVNKIIFHISDSGIGMNKEEIAMAFNRLYKADEARTDTGSGMGLGLSIAKEIIAAHQGEITAFSEKGKGSTFSIILPVQLKEEKVLHP